MSRLTGAWAEFYSGPESGKLMRPLSRQVLGMVLIGAVLLLYILARFWRAMHWTFR